MKLVTLTMRGACATCNRDFPEGSKVRMVPHYGLFCARCFALRCPCGKPAQKVSRFCAACAGNAVIG